MSTTLTQDEIKAFKGKGWLLNKGTDSFSARVVTVNGKLSVDKLLAVAEAARKFGSGEVTFTSRQGIEVLGVPAGKTADFENALAAAGLSVGGTGPRVRPVMSCKGTVCPRGLIDTFSLSQKIHERFYVGWHGVALPSTTSACRGPSFPAASAATRSPSADTGDAPAPPAFPSPSSLKARTRCCRSSTARFPSTATTASRASVSSRRLNGSVSTPPSR